MPCNFYEDLIFKIKGMLCCISVVMKKMNSITIAKEKHTIFFLIQAKVEEEEEDLTIPEYNSETPIGKYTGTNVAVVVVGEHVSGICLKAVLLSICQSS